MSVIDWDKAPEDATGYLPESDLYYACWVKPGFSMRLVDQKSWVVSSIEQVSDLVIQRPSQPWSGDGLPPVGVDLQWFSSVYGWIGGKVVAHDGQTTIVRHNDGYEGCYLHNLKPCKNPEQIAADEREVAVAEMLGLFGGTDSRDTYLMQRLYDAGYRKAEVNDAV